MIINSFYDKVPTHLFLQKERTDTTRTGAEKCDPATKVDIVNLFWVCLMFEIL
jgi:hypothetical protein